MTSLARIHTLGAGVRSSIKSHLTRFLDRTRGALTEAPSRLEPVRKIPLRPDIRQSTATHRKSGTSRRRTTQRRQWRSPVQKPRPCCPMRRARCCSEYRPNLIDTRTGGERARASSVSREHARTHTAPHTSGVCRPGTRTLVEQLVRGGAHGACLLSRSLLSSWAFLSLAQRRNAGLDHSLRSCIAE